MIFIKSVFISFAKYITFTGRSSRSEYIYWLIFLTISGALGEFIRYYFMAFLIFFSIPTVSIFFRRLHDIGKSGWWSILMFSPSFLIFPLVILFTKYDYLFWYILLPYSVLVWLLYIYLMIKPGDKESNKFGSPPKSIDEQLKNL